MLWISTVGILGMSLNRVNVAGLATVSAMNYLYLPAWTEWIVTIGILSGAGLVFLFCVERFGVFPAINRDRLDASYAPRRVDRGDWKTIFFHNPHSEIRVYSAAFVLAVGIALGFMPLDAVFGVQPEQTPTQGPRTVELSNIKIAGVPGRKFFVPLEQLKHSADGEAFLALMIDGNRNGDYVIFNHDMHIDKEGGRNDSCLRCHHMQNPYEEVSECYGCHSDMYLTADIFDHSYHVKKTSGNEGCTECHADPYATKIRSNSKPCEDCHETMRPPGTLVEIAKEDQTTLAAAYMDAMHEMCVGCHEERKHQLEEHNEDFDRCTTCHRDLPRLEDDPWKSRL